MNHRINKKVKLFNRINNTSTAYEDTSHPINCYDILEPYFDLIDLWLYDRQGNVNVYFKDPLNTAKYAEAFWREPDEPPN